MEQAADPATDKYKQQTVRVWQMASCLNANVADGWEYVGTIQYLPAPRYANGSAAGSDRVMLLFQRARGGSK